MAEAPLRRTPRGAQAVDVEIARRVRRRRLELGMTLHELAELIEAIHQQAHNYETGANRISAGRLHRIAQALGVEVGDFFADVDPMGHDWAGADKGRPRRLLELVRHVAAIRDPRQRQALCRLARDLAALGADETAA
jgi:transcriptional regulator with XRE-family HTH domain